MSQANTFEIKPEISVKVAREICFYFKYPIDVNVTLYSSTCHERTPSGPGKCPYNAGGRSSEGLMGKLKCVGTLIMWPYTAGGRSRRGSPKAGTTVYL